MTSKINAHLVSEYFAAYGGEIVVVSPGSRNAPLIKAFQAIEHIKCISVVDERSAGFVALGLSISTQKLVGVICTSGTALLNYAPAVAEAYYQGFPLIVMSADRPLDRIDKGDGQAIRQSNVFLNFQKGFLNIDENAGDKPDIHDDIKRVFDLAFESKQGPIHFNLPLSEPLYEDSKEENIIVQNDFPIVAKPITLSNELKNIWKSLDKTMIILGSLPVSKKLESLLNKLSGCVVLYESTSNIELAAGIGSIDRTLSACNELKLEPQLVITIGEQIISKRIKELLKNTSNLQHWHVCEDGKPLDTFASNSESIKMDSTQFVTQILKLEDINPSEYISCWNEGKSKGKQLHDRFLLNVPYSDLQVFDVILNSIPSNFHLQSGNSSVIRYIQLFDYNQWKSCHANRGTSGIDGSTSTAVGFSYGIKEPTVLITGDISFLYDSNGLWNKVIRQDFRIIVINNNGGGIFRIIPGPQTVPNHEEFFETIHDIDISHLAKAYGFEFTQVNNKLDLNDALISFYSASDSPKILEVQTPRKVNDEVLKDYFSYIKNNS